MFDGLIICAGMRRAASTWQYHLARDLAQRHGGKAWGFVTWQGLADKLAGWDGTPAVMKSHVYFPKHTPVLNEFIQAGRVRVLHSHRDLRQVAASMLRMAETMEIAYPDMLTELNAILESSMAWTAFPGVVIQPYDDIVAHPLRCIREIANTLEVSLSSSEVAELRRTYTRREQNKRQPRVGYDDETLLWAGHVSKKSYPDLPPELNQAIETHYGDWLRARGYL